MTKTVGITLGAMGHDGKKAMSFAASTIRAYTKLAIQLHQAACLTFYRAAQYGDCDSLNLFFAGLRVNDQTALRVWIGQHSSFVDLSNNEMRNWIKWSKDKGFTMVKGVEEYRKDMFTIDEQVEGKTMLLGLKPFYDKDVKDPKNFTLEELLEVLASAAKRATKKATDENIELPAGISALIRDIDRETSNELAALKRVNAE